MSNDKQRLALEIQDIAESFNRKLRECKSMGLIVSVHVANSFASVNHGEISASIKEEIVYGRNKSIPPPPTVQTGKPETKA